MTIADGGPEGEDGGGIRSQSALTVARVHLTENSARDGGAIHLDFDFGTILDSTISANTAERRAAGIFFRNGGRQPLRIVNSTISGNNLSGPDGALFVLAEGGIARAEVINSTITENVASLRGGIASVSLGGLEASVEVRNSIIANNADSNLAAFSDDGTAAIVSRGFNLADNDSAEFLNQSTDKNNANAGLLPLGNNGGPTPTHLLALDSDAIDAGDNSGSGQLLDQRGWRFTRSVDLPAPNTGDSSDIGAVERRSDLIFSDRFID